MKDFKYWDDQFKQGKMAAYNADEHGLLWLKLKSIIRKDVVVRFAKQAGITLNQTHLNMVFLELFAALAGDVPKANLLLDAFIRGVSTSQIAATDLDQLVSELYKLKYFDWGGDYQNSLDKYLVSRFVKTDNPSYENLLSKFDTEIEPAVRGYVLNSWYNYWSSVLIENIFKAHPAILPTIGKVKSVDFFIHGIPFDLKVTYFPSEYLAAERKAKGLPVELTFLKQQARDIGVVFDKSADASTIEHEIREKLKDRNDEDGRNIMDTLQNQNLAILDEARENSAKLAKWLYEHQGEMRFGAENRIYLILVDANDFSLSWKLKRNINLLRPVIARYLDKITSTGIKHMQVDFTFKGKTGTFSALADTIFVVSNQS
ncbi:MAG: hypothetical protein WCH61_00290 [bacterium]